MRQAAWAAVAAVALAIAGMILAACGDAHCTGSGLATTCPVSAYYPYGYPPRCPAGTLCPEGRGGGAGGGTFD